MSHKKDNYFKRTVNGVGKMKIKDLTNQRKRVNIKGDFESMGEIQKIEKDANKKAFEVKFHATEPTNYFDFDAEHEKDVKDILKSNGYKISEIRNVE